MCVIEGGMGMRERRTQKGYSQSSGPKASATRRALREEMWSAMA